MPVLPLVSIVLVPVIVSLGSTALKKSARQLGIAIMCRGERSCFTYEGEHLLAHLCCFSARLGSCTRARHRQCWLSAKTLGPFVTDLPRRSQVLPAHCAIGCCCLSRHRLSRFGSCLSWLCRQLGNKCQANHECMARVSMRSFDVMAFAVVWRNVVSPHSAHGEAVTE